MPNHCSNSLNIRAKTKDEIESIKAQLSHVNTLEDGTKETMPFSFQSIIPMPSNIFRGDLGEKEREEHGRNNWYDWACDHWDTKWDAYDVDLTQDDDLSIYITFNTAWSPPYKVIEELIKMFPDAEISMDFEEGGMGFFGKIDHTGYSVWDMPNLQEGEEEENGFYEELDMEMERIMLEDTPKQRVDFQ